MLVSVSLAFSAQSMAAGEHGTAQEATAMVKKVLTFMKANGKEKTLAEVNNLQGRFRDRDLYITINDLEGKNLAHGANAKMQGKDLIDLKDADGKPFMRERMELAKTKGKGWVDYRYNNPVTKNLEDKSTYLVRSGDLILEAGIYKVK